MLEPKYFVRLGGKYYAHTFYYAKSTLQYSGIQHYITEDINEARLFDSLGTAKRMATITSNGLLEWARLDPQNDPRPYEPIEVIEVALVEGPSVHTKHSIIPEIYHD